MSPFGHDQQTLVLHRIECGSHALKGGTSHCTDIPVSIGSGAT